MVYECLECALSWRGAGDGGAGHLGGGGESDSDLCVAAVECLWVYESFGCECMRWMGVGERRVFWFGGIEIIGESSDDCEGMRRRLS